jgi:hypothetical protein
MKDRVGTVAVGRQFAAVAWEGEPLRQFGAVDEVWVPFGDDGELVLNGPRFSGEALPDDVECDCICNGIDAALEAAGFGGWMTSEGLVDVACRDDPVWRRPGVTAQHQTYHLLVNVNASPWRIAPEALRASVTSTNGTSLRAPI